jgi:hypothetical protein
MAVVNALVSLYQAIQTVVRYARQILEIVSRVLDTIINIASGVIGPAAEMLENAMRGAMPVIIAFLANQAGLGGLGARMREIIANIRERVDNALLWLIDLALRALQALMNMLGLGGQRPGAQPPGRPVGAIGKVVNFTAAGEAHQIFIVKQGTNAVLMMASERKPLSEHEAELKRAAEQGMDNSDASQVSARVDAGAAEEVRVDRKADAVAAGTATANPQADEREIEQGQDRIAEQMRLALEKFRTTASGKRFERFRENSDYKPADMPTPKFAPASDASSGYAKSSFGSFMLVAYSGYVEENIIKPKKLTGEAYRLDLIAATRSLRLSKVSEMKYVIVEPVAGGPGYSRDVIDKAENVADVTLKRVVRGIGGILRFMEQMSRGSVTVGSDTIGREAFTRFWGTPENKNWLKNELRGEVSGRHHEWIPVSMIQEVIARAAQETDIRAAARWVALHNELRTSTRWIVFKPSIGGSTVSIGPRTYQMLNGHSGNLKRMENGVLKDATTNQQDFHDACRDAFRANNSTPVAAITALEVVFERWIWDGSPLPHPVHPDMYDSYGQRIADRMDVFSVRQGVYYSEIREYFREMKDRYR